jgi:hypothetical protein
MVNACPWSWNGREVKTPTLSKAESIGHAKKPDQSLSVDVLEWYHPSASIRQQKNHERACHPSVTYLRHCDQNSAFA